MTTRADLEAKTNTFFSRWSINLGIALTLLALALLGHLLGTANKEFTISLVWPATGFSLAALLLFGFRVWPAIFLGNFIYNFLDLQTANKDLIEILIATTCISLGSLIQALVGAYIIRKFSTKQYFTTVNDIVIFLFPAGIITCLIASSIGITTLYYIGEIAGKEIFSSWLTFYIGDLFGIYIYTPLIVVWLTHHLPEDFETHLGQTILMLLSFIVLTFLMTGMDWPIGQFYIPMAIWATYRYKMHGATLINFLISMTAIIPTIYGFGTWAFYLNTNQLFSIIIYLSAIVGTCLILAAVLNERLSAWIILREHNINLTEEIHTQKTTLSEMGSEIIVKEKLASLGVLTLNIARQIITPLRKIFALNENNQRNVEQLKAIYNKKKNEEDPEIQIHINELDHSLSEIARCEKQTSKVIKAIEDQSNRVSYALSDVKTINFHTLLNQCLEEVVAKTDVPSINLTKELSRQTATISALPQDLSYAFKHILNHSIQMIKSKIKQQGLSYQPQLSLKTIPHKETIEIIIRDNGVGVGKDELENFFYSFLDSNAPKDSTKIDLALAHDIIVHVHHGEITISSAKGQYFEFNIKLPLVEEDFNF